MAATIKDIARETGLSLATISKYLNGGNLREKNRAAIEAAIKKLDYHVNEYARGLKSKKSRTVGVVLPEISNLFNMKIVAVFERVLQENGYSVIVTDCQNNLEQEASSVDFLLKKQVDGIINVPIGSSSRHLRPAVEKKVPILLLDRPLQRTRHRPLIRNANGFARGITKTFPVILVIFALLVYPALHGYQKTNEEVYYDMGQCLPEDIDYVIANHKLIDDFDIASTHMVLVDTSLSSKELRAMQDEMENVDGVRYVLSLQSVLGSRVPAEVLPDSVRNIVESDKWQLWLISSEYRVASDAVNEQITDLLSILKKYDPSGMLIGEAPCMKDMIETTGHDFEVVNAVSILAIFAIILLVEKSLSLPFILISVIELAIFINLGLPHYMGQSLPFIAPICISTIQLGATVDYAILMTTRYKSERAAGRTKREAVQIALSTSTPSIIVSGMGLFAATFGVAVYSDIDIISSMCMLMARGAIISMLCVLLILPALLMLCDGLIRHTTLGMKVKTVKEEN